MKNSVVLWFCVLMLIVCSCRTSLNQGVDTYQLRPGDSLKIAFSNAHGPIHQPFCATIDSDGNITLPFIGKLRVSCMTLTQARKACESAYVGLENKPSINVSFCRIHHEPN